MKKFKILIFLSFFINCAVQCSEEKYVYVNEHDKNTISMVSNFQYLEFWSEEDINQKHQKILEGIKKEFNSFKGKKTIKKHSEYNTITLSTFYFDDIILNGIKEILYSSGLVIDKLRFSKSVFKTQELFDNLDETFPKQDVDAKYGNTVK